MQQDDFFHRNSGYEVQQDIYHDLAVQSYNHVQTGDAKLNQQQAHRQHQQRYQSAFEYSQSPKKTRSSKSQHRNMSGKHHQDNRNHVHFDPEESEQLGHIRHQISSKMPDNVHPLINEQKLCQTEAGSRNYLKRQRKGSAR